MAFDIDTCSNQDFATHMATTHARCAEIFYGRQDRSGAERNQALFVEYLHAAMGYRREHLTDDQF